MKTAFLFKSKPNLCDLTIDEKNGIYYTTVTSDLTFLDNVVVKGPDYDIRLFVKQKVDKPNKFVGIPTLWILFLSSQFRMENESYEKVWNLTSELCTKLYPYIKMGIELKHIEAWIYPNIPTKWNIEKTQLSFDSSPKGVRIYWADPSIKLYEENGEMKGNYTTKNITADFVTAIGSENLLAQIHTTHITIPNQNIQIGKKDFHIENDVINIIEEKGFDYLENEHELKVLKLYTSAITNKNLFASFLLYYQILEYIEKKITKPNKLKSTSIKKLKEFIENDIELKQKKSRLMGAIGNIKEETSFEMLNKGLFELVGNENIEKLGLTEDLFKNWRHSRGNLSHAEKEPKITENSLIKRYASLKQFCNNLIDVILKKYGF